MNERYACRRKFPFSYTMGEGGGGKGGGVWPMLIKIVWLGERELRHTNTLNLHGIGKELMATIHDP